MAFQMLLVNKGGGTCDLMRKLFPLTSQVLELMNFLVVHPLELNKDGFSIFLPK